MCQRFSIIILTFGRDLSLARTLDALRSDLGSDRRCEVILVDNNADGRDRSVFLNGFCSFRLIAPTVNQGVAGGRNLGIRAASGRILVFLDDDAIPAGPHLLDSVDEVFSEDPLIGIVAFRSIVVDSNGVWHTDRREFPHTNKRLSPVKPFDTFRFIGVGHAVRASVLAEVGLYLPEFRYSMEEFDISFRVLKAGYRIVYRPNITVRHMKEPSGRLPSKEVLRQSLLNKLRVSWMHLPVIQMVICMTAWTGKTVLSDRSLSEAAGAWHEFIKWTWRHGQSRNPLAPSILGSIVSMGGQVWK